MLNIFLGSNMWPFSYFKKLKEAKIRRAEEELRLAEEAKQKAIAERKASYNTRKEYINELVTTHNKEQAQKRNNHIDKKEKENKEANHKCPRCGCTETIEVFRRPKGELNGSFSSSSSSSYSHSACLFTSRGYGESSHSSRGDIKGSLDTLKVNRCTKCEHEWEILPEVIYPSQVDYFFGEEDWGTYAKYFINDVTRLIHKIEEFDPNQLDNKFNSVDEIIEDAKNDIWYKKVKDWSLELLYYMAYQNKYDIRREEEVFAEYNYNDGGQDYLGSFEPKFEAFLMEHFGFKKHFE